MKILINLTISSLLNRKVTVFLTIISLTLSITLFLSIDTLRIGAKKSFFGNVKSGDLILGSRSGEIQLLLYSLFQIGSPTNNISWQSFKEISKNKNIDWIIPISLGDSHKQFRVLATNKEYFKRYRYRKNKKLIFNEGNTFEGLFDVVIGKDVASSLNYKLGDNIIVAHGIASQSLHDEFPFKITGILEKSGTSVDRLVIIRLEAFEAIHKDWKSGTRIPGIKKKNINFSNENLEPKEITAAIIKLKSKIKIFDTQREINNFQEESLQAIIPGITLSKLWRVISVTENVMLAISIMVIVSSFIGMTAILLSNLNGRKQEMFLLRIVGASPKAIFGLMIMEGFLIAFVSILLSVMFTQILSIVFYPLLDNLFGIYLEYKFLSYTDFLFCIIILFLSVLISILPGFIAVKKTINEGI